MSEQQEDLFSDKKPARPSFAPGIHENISNEDYHRSAGISCTGLKKIAKSPALFKVGGGGQTAAMAMGSAVHAAILEPELFASQYVTLAKGKDRRSSEYKGLVEAHGESNVLVSADAYQIGAMQDAVKANPKARQWLYEEPGRNELSVYAKDPETGIAVRCRFDRLLDRGFSPDLKTTTDASIDGFSRIIDKFGYAFQAAFYLDVYRWATGETLDGFGFIAVEKTAPYHVMCYRLGDESIQIGRSQYREALIKYAECLDSGIWPGYDGCDDENVIELPYYAFNKFEEGLEVNIDE